MQNMRQCQVDSSQEQSLSKSLRRRTVVLNSWQNSPSTITLAPFRVLGINDGYKFVPKWNEIQPPYMKKYFIERRNMLLSVITDPIYFRQNAAATGGQLPTEPRANQQQPRSLAREVARPKGQTRSEPAKTRTQPRNGSSGIKKSESLPTSLSTTKLKKLEPSIGKGRKATETLHQLEELSKTYEQMVDQKDILELTSHLDLSPNIKSIRNMRMISKGKKPAIPTPPNHEETVMSLFKQNNRNAQDQQDKGIAPNMNKQNMNIKLRIEQLTKNINEKLKNQKLFPKQN